MKPMNYLERQKIRENLLRAKAYAEEAIEMLESDQAKGFRHAVREAKDSLDGAQAAFTSAEDRRQTS